MTGDELRTAMQNIANARTPAAELKATIQLLVHEDELAAALDDRDRLEWLEQTGWSDKIGNGLAIFPGTFLDGRRFVGLQDMGDEDGSNLGDEMCKGTTLRAAIDAARGKS